MPLTDAVDVAIWGSGPAAMIAWHVGVLVIWPPVLTAVMMSLRGRR